MKGCKFIKQFSDVMFWASGAGMAFSGIMMFASSRPFRSAGCIFICMGMALAWANLEVWAEKQMVLKRDAEIAEKVFKETKANRLEELYESDYETAV